MIKEEFVALVRRHDLTFMYSDDARVRQTGWDALNRIRDEAKAFDKDWVAKVWNANVDRVMLEGYRKEFYWNE